MGAPRHSGKPYDEVVALLDGDTPPVCEWNTFCADAATSIRVHSAIGSIPICTRCILNVGAVKAARR